jgi:hypothetical protein
VSGLILEATTISEARMVRSSGVALLVLMTTSAFATAGVRSDAGAVNDRIVEVDNRTTENLTLYAVPDGGRPIRIGRAEAGSEVKLRIPGGVASAGALQLLAYARHGQAASVDGFVDPMARITSPPGGSYVTLPFSAVEDMRIRWSIEPVRAVSSVTAVPRWGPRE